MTSFNETFDVELLIHLAQHYGPQALAVELIAGGPEPDDRPRAAGRV